MRPFTAFVERFYPDPFVFVILLTLLTFLMAFGMTGAGAGESIAAWGDGLSQLMPFIAQISIMLVGAHALAHTGPVQTGLTALARLPNSAGQAYLLVVLVASAASLFAWSFALVGGAIIARQVAIEADRRGLKIHYPLLVASAYSGFAVWHMGYSGSAPLFVATSGHILEGEIGVLPVSETILSGWNLLTAFVAIAVMAVICPRMHPRHGEIRSVPAAVLDEISEADEDESYDQTSGASRTFASRLNHSRLLTTIFGLALMGYLASWFIERGPAFDLNIVIWTILCLLLLLARSPLHLIHLIREASGTLGPVLIQYPFYGGIMGLMAGTGLIALFSQAFIQVSSPDTLTLWAFLSGGIVNLFVPSGGGQWVVQGPIFIDAAKSLGVDPALIVMSIAYGDQWTNLAQPFWTLPLLAIAGLEVRHIMGYCFLVLIALFAVFAGALLILGAAP